MHWFEEDRSTQAEVAKKWIDQAKALTPEMAIIEQLLPEAYNRAVKRHGLALPSGELQKMLRELYEMARHTIATIRENG